MQNIGKGFVAGFIATIVLSALMLMKSMMGMMPALDVIRMITKMLEASSPAVGWSVHFFIGTILWGALFSVLDPFLFGPHWLRGAIFASGAWVLMMIVMMPIAGVGLFAIQLGIMAPIATLILHWIFGVVLGATYGALLGRGESKQAHA